MPDLLVSPYTPTMRSGRALRTYAVSRALDHAEILHTRFGADAAAREFDGFDLHPVEASRGIARAALYCSARAQGVPDSFARSWAPELRQAALQRAGTLAGGRLVADGPGVASLLARDRPVIYLAHNIESQLERSGRRAMRRFEARLLQAAEESWLVSERDIEIARTLAPQARIRLVPNAIDVEAIEPVDPAGSTILIVADYVYEPNAAALQFMLDEVMPQLWRRSPQARLRVVGRSMPPLAGREPRVEAVGEVDDLLTAYRGSCCAVVPLFSGSGSPLKFVEALAYGLPVIATGFAAAGLDAVAGEHYLRADDATAFSDTLAGVLATGAGQIAKNGRRLAAERYSIESLRRALAG